MPPIDLTESLLTSTQVFDGVLLKVHKDEVSLPDGNTSTREYIKHPGAAVIVPLFADGRLLMVRQYRYAIRQHTLELPAGKRDNGEAFSITAHREIIEEVGHRASTLVSLGTIHPSIGYADEVIELFLATDLTPEAGTTDPDEFVQVVETTLDEAQGWVREGKITDVKTIIALGWTRDYLRTS